MIGIWYSGFGFARAPGNPAPPRQSVMSSALYSGTNTSFARTDFEPVARMPSTFQSSTISYSERCTRHMRQPVTRSPSYTCAASMFHSDGSTPLEKFQWPLSENPPSTLRARPCGNAIPEAISASGFAPHTSSCARSSYSASIQWWMPRLPTFQAMEGQPRASSAGRSMNDTKSSSMPP